MVDRILERKVGKEPVFPLPDNAGKIDKKQYYDFMGGLRSKVKEWIANKDFGLVKESWVVPFDKAEDGYGGMIMGFGIVESKDKDFPYTPMFWMIPMERDVSLEAWKQSTQEVRNVNLEELIKARLVDVDKGAHALGGEGYLVTNVHGWGGNPMSPWRMMRGMGVEAKKQNKDLSKMVFLSMGTQGSLGTIVGDPKSKSLESVPNQIEGTLNNIAEQLADKDVIGMGNFWNRYKLAIGHSMGGHAVFRWLLENSQSEEWSKKCKNLKVLAMDMMIRGSRASKDERRKAQAFLNVLEDEQVVKLHELSVRGLMTQNAQLIMGPQLIREIADRSPILKTLISSFMGKLRDWETLVHMETAYRDIPMIGANNHMLEQAKSLIQSAGELDFAKTLIAEGKLLLAWGTEDDILETDPIAKSAKKMDAENFGDTKEHYAGWEFFIRLLNIL